MRPLSRTPRFFRGPGRSACRCIAVWRRMPGFWNTSARNSRRSCCMGRYARSPVTRSAEEAPMIRRSLASTTTLAAMIAVLLIAQAPAAGQAQSPATKSAPAKATSTGGKSWTPPRTPDGKPDLQGVWTNNTVTPLERPKELAGKEFYTEAELQALAKQERERLVQVEEEGQPPANHSGIEGEPADDVHYDFSQYGLDRGQAKLAWNRRTSMIVGPEGRIPPLTPEAQKRGAERRARAKGHEFDGPENRPLGARCLALRTVGPPLLPSGYNSNLQIVAGAGYMAIESEMIHDVR